MMSQRPPMTRKEALRLLRIRKDQLRRDAASAARRAARKVEEAKALHQRMEVIRDRVALARIHMTAALGLPEAAVPRAVFLDDRGRLCADRTKGFDIIVIPETDGRRNANDMRAWLVNHLTKQESRAA